MIIGPSGRMSLGDEYGSDGAGRGDSGACERFEEKRMNRSVARIGRLLPAIGLIAVMLLVVTSCDSQPPSPPTPTSTGVPIAAATLMPTETPVPTPTTASAPTDTPVRTLAPEPTATLAPTNTPTPTNTPGPTATPTFVPTATPSSAATLTPMERDRAILIALYEATDGANWTNNTNWLTDAPIGEWHGVTTDGDSRVSGIVLGQNGLTGNLPAELGGLASLTNLSLWGNQLTGPVPPELSDLSDLERLDLGGNDLTGGFPAWLANLSGLTNLSLWGNELSGPIPSGLGRLQNLETLDIRTNQLTGTIPPSLANLSDLRNLLLNDNQLSGSVPDWLTGLTKLERLQLAGNALTGCIPPALQNVATNDLAELDLPSCDADTVSSSLPDGSGVLTFDDPDVPHLKWEVGPEVLEEYYQYARAGIVYLHRYAAPLGLPPLPDDSTFYLYYNLDLAARTLARLENRSVESARSAFVDDSWGGLAGLEDVDSGWTMLNLPSLAQDGQPRGFMKVAAHELFHVYQYTLQGYGRFSFTHSEVRVIGPAWMQEGVCEFQAIAALAKGGIWPYAQSHQRYANEAREVDVSLREMETYNVLLDGPGRFALATMGAEFLAAKAGEEALMTFWTLLGPGTTWQEAFNTAFGMTIDDFYSLFEEHRAAGFPAPDLPGAVPRFPLAETDRAALTALYNATGGANWANSDNWLSDEPGNQWHGVNINSDGHVTRLDLQENQLHGTIPAELGSLVDLERLILFDNGLTGEIPNELGNLAGLRQLELANNRLDGAIPASLGNLSSLTNLGLDHNRLTGTIPSALGSLSNLNGLWLQGNELSGEIPASLGNLSNLTRLSLARNQLSGPIPPQLGNLSKLELIRLAENAFTGCVPVALQNVANNDLVNLGLPFC